MPTLAAERSIHTTRWLKPPASVAPARRAEIDLLRVTTMLLVLVVHAAEPFNPWDAWHVQSPEPSKWLGELVLLLAPWVMPLFMLLAGLSAWYSLGIRSTAEYLHERVTRVLVPLIAGILLLVPPQMYIDRRQRGLFAGSLPEFYPHFFDGLYPDGNFGWLHLWFLGLLAASALITLPLFRWLRGRRGRQAMSGLARICTPQAAILLLAMPALAVRATLWWMFSDSPPIVTDWSNRTVLLPLFIYGYMLAGEPALMRAVDRQWKVALAVAMVFSAAMFAWAWPGDVTERFPEPFSPAYLLLWSMYTLGGWAWPVALFGAARAMRLGERRLLARARGLVNPFYMLHQPVIVVLAFYLVRRPTSPGPTFLLLLAGSCAVTVALCALVRRWRVTALLFGVHRSYVSNAGPGAYGPIPLPPPRSTCA